jgi:hypothetical protein
MYLFILFAIITCLICLFDIFSTDHSDGESHYGTCDCWGCMTKNERYIGILYSLISSVVVTIIFMVIIIMMLFNGIIWIFKLIKRKT